MIGAGASGLAAAYRLRQAGVDVTVFEKNGDVGRHLARERLPGLPGRRAQPALQLLLRPDQRLGLAVLGTARPAGLPAGRRPRSSAWGSASASASEVTEARFDDEARVWSLTRAGPATAPSGVEAFDGIVCAVGQLNRPSFPAIAGRERFRGPSFHSAAWDDAVELAGRRVAVIGTGASAAQFVPCLVDEVAHLDVYQRTPPWLLPTDNYGDPFPPEFHDLLRLLPDLRALGPAVAVLAHARGAARGRPGRSRVGRAHRGGERGQRLRALHAARRPARPGGRRRALREDGARTSRPSPSGRSATTGGGRRPWAGRTSTS